MAVKPNPKPKPTPKPPIVKPLGDEEDEGAPHPAKPKP